MGLLWAIISWIIIGGLIGLIARAVMPGKQRMGFMMTVIPVSYTHLRAHETPGLGDVYKRQGFMMTVILGVVGAIVGGFTVGLLGGDGVSGIMNNPWSLGTILLAVIGALIVMVIYGFLARKAND